MMIFVALIALILGLMVVSILMHAVFSIFWSLLIGFVVGSIAKFIMPPSDKSGFLLTALLGMGGSMLASVLGHLLHLPGRGAGFLASIAGAVLLLFLFRVFGQERVES